jgi:hypothetical protein
MTNLMVAFRIVVKARKDVIMFKCLVLAKRKNPQLVGLMNTEYLWLVILCIISKDDLYLWRY